MEVSSNIDHYAGYNLLNTPQIAAFATAHDVPYNPYGNDYYWVPVQTAVPQDQAIGGAANPIDPSTTDSKAASAPVNPAFGASQIYMGETTYALNNNEPARVGFNAPGADEPDRHNIIFPLLGSSDQVRTFAISNLRSITDAQLKDLLTVFGPSFSTYTRMINGELKWGDIAYLTFISAEDTDIALEVLPHVKVLRKKTQEEKAAEANGKTQTYGVNGHANGIKKEENADEDTKMTETGSAAPEDEVDSLVINVDNITSSYLQHWASITGNRMAPEQFENEVQRRIAALQPKLAAISAMNQQWNLAPYVKDEAKDDIKQEDPNSLDAGELAKMKDSYDDNAADDDDDNPISAEVMQKVREEIAQFRHKSILLDKDRLRREENRRKQRDDAAEADRDGLPTGPKAERVGNKPRKPADADEHWYLSRNGVWVDGYLFKITDEDRMEGLNAEQCLKQRKAEREYQKEPEFEKLLRQVVARQERKIAAHQRAEARARLEENRKKADREERIKWEENYDEERYKHEDDHLYFRDRAQWERQARAERADREEWEEMDRRAEAEEKAQADGTKRRNQGLADAFLNEQADAMVAAQQQSVGFKLSLSAAAAQRQQQRDRRNNAVAEKLLAADNEDEPKPARRLLPPLAEDNESSGLSEEQKKAGEEKLALEIKEAEADGRLYDWPVRWDILTAAFIKSRLRPWLEDKSIKYFAVVDDDFVRALEKKLVSRAPATEYKETFEELLDEDTGEFVGTLWKMLVFVTEQTGRGLA